jgi:hypothetical protein
VNNHTSPYQMSKTSKELSPCCKCTAVEGGTGAKAGGTKSNTSCRLVHEKEVSSTPRRSRGMYMSKSNSHSTTMRDNIGSNRNTTSTILCTSAGGYGGSIFSGRRGGNEQLVVSSLGTRCAHDAHGRLGVSGKRTTGGRRENRSVTTAKKQGGLSFFVYLICCCYVCSYARYVFALLLSRDICVYLGIYFA